MVHQVPSFHSCHFSCSGAGISKTIPEERKIRHAFDFFCEKRKALRRREAGLISVSLMEYEVLCSEEGQEAASPDDVFFNYR
jgi:hypothetical protein